jgi:hypothetical protein
MFKIIFNLIEKTIQVGESFGFFVAKAINKFFYGLIFSSFDESKERLKIEKARLETEKQEIKNKQEKLEIEEQKYKEKIDEINTLLDMEKIDKDILVKLQNERKQLSTELKSTREKLKITEKQLEEAQRITKVVKRLNVQTKNIVKSEKGDNKDTLIKSLQEKITILKRDIEILKSARKYEGETLNSVVKDLKKPKLQKDSNPIKFMRNFIQYKKDQSEFKKQVQKYVSTAKLGKQNRSRQLKMDTIQEYNRYLKIGDTFTRVYYLADIPNYLLVSALFRLINMPIPLTLSYHIEATSTGAMKHAVKQRRSILMARGMGRAEKGKIRDINLERELQQLEEFESKLLSGEEKPFLVSLYAVIYADSYDELLKYDKKFQQTSSDIEFTFNTYSFGQKEVFKSTLPFCEDTVEESRLLQTSAVANILPFLTRNLNDPEGIFLGTNHYNKSILLIDLFKARNANMNIFGTSGSGKSVTSKLILTRLTLRGIQNIILDPEGEYTALTKSLGGEVVKFNRERGINPFFIGKAGDNSVKDHISVLKHFFRFFIQEDRYDSAKLDKLLIKTYESSEPVFKTFLEITKDESKHDESIKFVEDLEQLQTGSLAGIFNSEKPIKLSSDILCFDLSDLKTDEKKIPAMYLLGTIINRLISDGSRRRRMIYIDESHKLLVNKQTTNFYVDLVKTARKRKAGVVSITQNPEDFTNENRAKTVLTQAETSILLKQAPASINYIKENNLFQLTENELTDLPTFGIGEALFVREREHIYMDVIPFPKEQDLVFTD